MFVHRFTVVRSRIRWLDEKQSGIVVVVGAVNPGDKGLFLQVSPMSQGGDNVGTTDGVTVNACEVPAHASVIHSGPQAFPQLCPQGMEVSRDSGF